MAQIFSVRGKDPTPGSVRNLRSYFQKEISAICDLLGLSDYRQQSVEFSSLAADLAAAAPSKKRPSRGHLSYESQILTQPIGTWPMPGFPAPSRRQGNANPRSARRRKPTSARQGIRNSSIDEAVGLAGGGLASARWHRACRRRSAICSLGCAMSLPMAAMPAISWPRHWPDTRPVVNRDRQTVRFCGSRVLTRR